VRLFDDLSTSPTVVSTNAGFAMLTVILIFLTAQIFNKTLEENDHEIRSFFRGLTSPFTRTWEAGASRFSLPAIAGPLGMISLAALIYGFGEPDFGLNKRSSVLLVSYLGSSRHDYIYEGGQALMAALIPGHSEGLCRVGLRNLRRPDAVEASSRASSSPVAGMPYSPARPGAGGQTVCTCALYGPGRAPICWRAIPHTGRRHGLLAGIYPGLSVNSSPRCRGCSLR
jgi:hypothetical protein